MTTIHSRIYRDGEVVAENVTRERLDALLDDPSLLVLVDFEDASRGDLEWITDQLHLHPIAVTDAVEIHTRPKIERYDTHDFLVCYDVAVADGVPELKTTELSLFVAKRAIVSVHRGSAKFFAKLEDRLSRHPELKTSGTYALFWGLLDTVVDSHFDAVQALDDHLDSLEDRVFSDTSPSADTGLQRDLFSARKQLVQLRRLTLPMREIVNSVLRDEQSGIDEVLRPYFADVYDHTLRVNEWVDSMRDLVTSLLDASLTIQGNRMNMIMKKVTSWAAIIAVPTLITGFFGQNVAFFGFGAWTGLALSVALIVLSVVVLYRLFRSHDWL